MKKVKPSKWGAAVATLELAAKEIKRAQPSRARELIRAAALLKAQSP